MCCSSICRWVSLDQHRQVDGDDLDATEYSLELGDGSGLNDDLNPDSFDFIKANIVAPPIVELGGAGAGMVGHSGRVLQCPAIL